MTPPKKPFFARLDGWIVIGIAFAVLAFMFSGSGGDKLPKEIREQAKSIPDEIERAAAGIRKMAEQYRSLAASPDFSDLARFADKEKWAGKFDQAQAELGRAEKLYESDLKPLVKENRAEGTPQVTRQLKRIREVIENARDQAKFPTRRMSEIRKVIAQIDQTVPAAEKQTREISGIVSQASSSELEKALADFPDLSEKTRARFAPLKKLEEESQAALDLLQEQYQKHQNGQGADYAAMTDSVLAISRGLETAKELEQSFKDDVAQLYTSYTKILKDMKQDLTVVIKRESWDEASDYYNPAYATFERQVSPEVYEALTKDGIDSIAEITSGFSGSRLVNHVGSAWQALEINPTENWQNRSHNAASFWVEDTKEAYYHQYLIEENGETRETGWEKVDGSFYESCLPLLGMAILSKPYGMYEADRLTQAAPPGMSYVGNEKYGEWKKDDHGDRFWSWYGRYAFFSTLFFPPSYIYYNSWNGWHRDYRYSRPYFGTTRDGFQKYGTHGSAVKGSPKFQSSSFAKSGGFRSQAASVRGAGQGLRGGGPGSKGK